MTQKLAGVDPHLTNQSGRIPGARRIIAVLMVVQALGGFSAGVAFGLGSLLAAQLGGMFWGGAAVTGTTLGGALIAQPLARVAARYGRRVSLMTGMGIGLLGTITCVLAAQLGSLFLLVAGFFLLGGALATNLQTRFAAADVATELTRGRTVSLVLWATTFGTVIGPNMYGFATATGRLLGIREEAGGYFISTCVQLVSLGVLFFGLAGMKRVTAQVQRIQAVDAVVPPVRDESMETPAADRAFPAAAWPPILMLMANHFVMTMLMSMTSVYMDHHGASLTIIGLTFSLHTLGMYGFSPVMGWCADRVGRGWVLVTGFAMSGVAAAMLILTQGMGHSYTLMALFLLGLGWSAGMVAGSALLVDAVPGSHRTLVQGRSDVIMSLAAATGGLVSGSILSFGGMTLLAGIGLATVAVSLVLWLIRRR